jgi:catechol 2,3-dioxygenase-like lactoylglutathione lyase family enzyme
MGAQVVADAKVRANVQQAVPFFMVSDIETSIRFYVDGLGFEITRKWINKGKLEWCWLQNGGASLMLQEFRSDKIPSGKLGEGVSVCFQCSDALAIYHAAAARGIKATKRPFVGNAMWVVIFSDPNGYRVEFESPTDVPEETEYSEP